MRAKDILTYALTLVVLDAAQLAYTKMRQIACERYGIKAESGPDIASNIKDAAWRKVDDVD